MSAQQCPTSRGEGSLLEATWAGLLPICGLIHQGLLCSRGLETGCVESTLGKPTLPPEVCSTPSCSPLPPACVSDERFRPLLDRVTGLPFEADLRLPPPLMAAAMAALAASVAPASITLEVTT